MKCLACDTVLTDREATRKSLKTGEFIDLCDDCFRPISKDIVTIEGKDFFPDDTNGEEE